MIIFVFSHMTKQKKYLENSNSCNNLYKDYRKKKTSYKIHHRRKTISQHLCWVCIFLYIHTS